MAIAARSSQHHHSSGFSSAAALSPIGSKASPHVVNTQVVSNQAQSLHHSFVDSEHGVPNGSNSAQVSSSDDSQTTHMRSGGASSGTSSGSDSESIPMQNHSHSSASSSVPKGFIRSVASTDHSHTSSRRSESYGLPATELSQQQQKHLYGQHKQQQRLNIVEATKISDASEHSFSFHSADSDDLPPVSPSGFALSTTSDHYLNTCNSAVRPRTDDCCQAPSSKLARSKSDHTHTHGTSSEQNRLRVSAWAGPSAHSLPHSAGTDGHQASFAPPFHSVPANVQSRSRDQQFTLPLQNHPRSRSCARSNEPFIIPNRVISSPTSSSCYAVVPTAARTTDHRHVSNGESPPSYAQMMQQQLQQSQQVPLKVTNDEHHHQLAAYRQSHNFSLVA
jgi:hypothetical protein